MTAELTEPLLEGLKEVSAIHFALNAGDNVVGMPHDDHAQAGRSAPA
ncbi:hypothetical protein APY03_5025 [Variovorax sp. WDL1]|nr:hypothetical protein APY03_5025 [Variovorax sp. WDL1]